MEKTAKIYVAGHHGLVGSAIWNNLQKKGYTNLVGCSGNGSRYSIQSQTTVTVTEKWHVSISRQS